jgi:hypothetical protein
MNNKIQNRIVIRLITISLLITFQSCIAHFPQYDLQKYNYESVVKNDNKPTMDYEVHSSDITSLQMLSKELEALFEKSEYFSKIENSNGTSAFHLSITYEYYIKEHLTFHGLMQLLGLIIFVIPQHDKTETYILTIDVMKDNKFIKQYKYDYYVDGWMGIEFIPYFPIEVANKNKYTYWYIFDCLITKFLYDLRQDKLLCS